jgi:hypothetical protein
VLPGHSSSGYDVDIVFVDYWSRYKRDNSTLFPVSMTRTLCHEGKLESGFVDLGGAIFSLKRFRKEQHRFMRFGRLNAQDGLTFELLKAMGWKTFHVRKCLFGHSPNPVTCRELGGYWFNSPVTRKEQAESCWSEEQLQKEKQKRGNLKVTVNRFAILPIKEQALAYRALTEDQVKFSKKYFEKVSQFRVDYCRNLQKSGYKLNVKEFLKLHPQLKAYKTDAQVVHYFNVWGCKEGIKIPKKDEPWGYYVGIQLPL